MGWSFFISLNGQVSLACRFLWSASSQIRNCIFMCHFLTPLKWYLFSRIHSEDRPFRFSLRDGTAGGSANSRRHRRQTNHTTDAIGPSAAAVAATSSQGTRVKHLGDPSVTEASPTGGHRKVLAVDAGGSAGTEESSGVCSGESAVHPECKSVPALLHHFSVGFIASWKMNFSACVVSNVSIKDESRLFHCSTWRPFTTLLFLLEPFFTCHNGASLSYVAAIST